MNGDLLQELYRHARELDVNRCDAMSLSGWLHGYLSLYTAVRVYPWLEKDLDGVTALHERVRAIGRRLQRLAGEEDLPAATRARHVADLLDAYQLYIEVGFVDTGLEMAHQLLTAPGSDRLVLPCRTPDVCRLLCQCHYFTGDDAFIAPARGLVTEALGASYRWQGEELLEWWKAFQLYDSVMGFQTVEPGDRERFEGELQRLAVNVDCVEREMVERFTPGVPGNGMAAEARVFEILAGQLLRNCNEEEGKRI